MGRPADSAPRVRPGGDGGGAEGARRAALAQLAIGVPAFTVVLFGLVLGFVLSERKIDLVFWGVSLPVAAAFAAYLGRAIVALRKAGRLGERARNEENEED